MHRVLETSTDRHHFYGFALLTSGRDLDAPKRASEDPNPKTRMLGLTPIGFFRVDAPKTPMAGVFGDPLEIEMFIYLGGRAERRQTNKKVSLF